MSSTETDHGWYLRQQPTDAQSKKQARHVDFELERIKSLGVVTVLNKAFVQETPSPSLPILSERSPSPGLTRQDIQSKVEQATSCNKGMSASNLRDTLVRKQSSPVLQKTAKVASYDEYDLLAGTQSHIAHQKEGLSANSHRNDAASETAHTPQRCINLDTSVDVHTRNDMANEDNALQARIKELERLYTESMVQLENFQRQTVEYKQRQEHVEQATHDALASTLEQKELESVKVRQLSDVVFKQDRLVHELENHLERVRQENQRLKSTSLARELKTVREELDSLRPELLKILEDKNGCEQTISCLRDELEQCQETTRKTMDLSQELQTQCVTQQTHIDSKLQLLTRLLQEKDQQIKKYRDLAARRVSVIPETQTISTSALAVAHCHDVDGVEEDSGTTVATDSRSTSFSFYSTSQPLVRDSCQSSSSTANLTTATTSTSSMSTLTSNSSNPPFNSLSKRSYVIKWAGGSIPPAAPPPTIPVPPLPPSSDDTPPVKQTNPAPSINRNSILEFAKQLEERLSLCKDFSELRVWEPSDFTLLPLTETPPPPPPKSSPPSKLKETSPFWKGVKKRFRV